MIPANNFERSFSSEEMRKSADFGSRLDKGMIAMVICNARLHQPVRNLGEISVSLEMELSNHPVWDPRKKIAGAFVQLVLRMKFDKSHPVESLRDTELLTLQVGYGVDGELKELYEQESDLQEGLRCFSEIGAVLSCWPMLRETVMTVSSKTGIQPIILPFVRYSTKGEADKGSKRKAAKRAK